MHSTSRARVRRRFVMAAVVCLSVLALAPSTALAKTTTWTHLGGDDLWSNPGNWDNGVPMMSDDVFFSAVGGSSVMDIPGLGLTNMYMMGFTGTLDLAQSLSVLGDVVTDGTFDMSGSALAVGGHLTALGDVDATSGTIDVGSDIYAAAGFTAPDLFLVVGGHATFEGTTTDMTSANVQVTGNMTVGGSFFADGATITVMQSFHALTAATLDMGNASLLLGNDLTVHDATMTWTGGGTLTFGVTGGFQDWSAGPSSSNYANVVISGGGGGGTTLSAPGTNVHVTGLSVSSGTFELADGDLTVDGNTAISSMGALENTTNAGAVLQFNGTVTVNDGTFRSTAGGCTLRFAPGPGGTLDANGTATLEIGGVPADRTRLEQDGVAGGTQWILDYEPGTSLTFHDLEVQDSDAQGATPATVTGSGIDLCNNTNWEFPPKITTWTGLGVTDNWSECANWDLGAPGIGDDVLFNPVGGLSVMDIPGLGLNSMNMTGFTGTLDLAQPLSATGSVATDGIFDMTGGDLLVGGQLTVLDSMIATSGTISTDGGMSVNGGFTASGVVMVIGGDATFTGTTTDMTLANIQVTGDMVAAGSFLADGATIAVGGSFSESGGATLDMGGASLQLAGDLNVGGASMTWTSGGTLYLGGDGTWSAGPSSSSYPSVQVGAGGGTVELSAPGTTVDVADLSVSSGTLQLAGGDLTVDGNTTISAAGALENTTNAGATFQFNGTVTVNDGTFRSTAGGCTLRFAPGSGGTLDANGTATLEIGGVSINRTRLEQDGVVGGTQWILDYEAGTSLTFDKVEVQDSDAQGATPAIATGNSADLCNNTNWEFPSKITTWTGLGVTDNWSECANWDSGVPGPGDNVLFNPVGGLSVVDIPILGLDNLDMTGFAGTLDLAQPLSVTGSVVTDGIFDMAGGNLSVGSSLTVLDSMIATSGTIDTGGGVTIHGGLTASGAALTVGGDAIFAGTTAYVTFANIQVARDMDVGGSFLANGATILVMESFTASPAASLAMGSATLTVARDVDVSGAAACTWSSAGTLRFTGGGTQAWIPGPTSADFGDVEVVQAGGSRVELAPTGPTVTTLDLTVTQGTLASLGGDLTVNGNTTISPAGKLENLYNTGATLRFDGPVTVNDGTLRVTAGGCRVGFAPGPGATLDANGTATLEFTGVPGNRLRLEQDGAFGGARWVLDYEPGTSLTFHDVGVQDSDAQPGPVTATGTSVSLCNNSNWIFPAKITTWTGLGLTDAWSDCDNWDSGTPVAGDEVRFDPVGGLSIMDLAGLSLAAMDMSGFAGTLNLAQPLTVFGAAVTSGIFEMSGQALQVGGSLSVNGTLQGSFPTIDVGANMNVSGIVNTSGAGISVVGGLTVSGNFTSPTSLITLGGSATITGDADINLTSLDVPLDMYVDGSLLGDGSIVTVGGSFAAAPATVIDMGDGTLEVAGDLDLSGASSSWTSSGTLRFSGGGIQTWSAGPASSSYANLEVDGGGGGARVVLTAPGTLVAVNHLSITQEILELSSGDLTVSGSTTISPTGTLENTTNAGATIRFDGPVIVNDGTLRLTAGGCTVGFAAGPGGALEAIGTATVELGGVPGNRTRLEQDGVGGGTQWFLTHDAGVTMSFPDVQVQDGNAQPGPAVATGSSTSLGNNTNWVFPTKLTIWTGTGITDNWSDTDNWDNGVPASGDDVGFGPVAGLSVLDIPGLTLNAMDMTGYIGTLNLTQPLSVTNDVTTDGTVDMTGQALQVGGALNVNDSFLGNSATIDVGTNLDVSGTLDVTLANLDVTVDVHVDGSLLGDGSTVTVGGSFDVAPGTSLDMGGGTLEITGDLDVSGASSSWTSGGTVSFVGSGTQTWTSTSLSSGYAAVEIQTDPGARVVVTTSGAALGATDLSVLSGTLELAGGDGLTVNGNTSISAGAALENNTNAGATLEFHGAVVVNGTLSSTAVACTLRFDVGVPSALLVLPPGQVIVSGAPGNRTRLEQDGVYGGAQWILAYQPGTTLIFDEIEVQDSDAQPGPVTPSNSKDLGNNTNWDFGIKTTGWTGLGGTGMWSDFLNWDNGVPSTLDQVVFGPLAGISVMDIPGLLLGGLDMTGYTGVLELGTALDVMDDVTTSGTLDVAGHALGVGGDLATSGIVAAHGGNMSVGGSLHVGTGTLDVDASVLDVGGPVDGNPGATLLVGTGTFSLHADADFSTFSGVTFYPGGRLECMGSSDYSVDFGGAITLANVWVYHTSSAVKVTLRSSGSVTVGGELDVERGVLDLDMPDITVSGDTFIRLDGKVQGKYTPSYDVTFDGHIHVDGSFEKTWPSTTVTIRAGATINGTFRVEGDSVAVRVAPAETLSVHPGGTIKVIGGTLSNHARLLLDGAPGSDQWRLDVQTGSTAQFENVEVQDSDASPGETCIAGGESIDLGNNDNWNFVGTAAGDAPPSRLSMSAVPNPFNPRTTLHYGVPTAGNVTIRIYDVQGRMVRELLSAARAPGVYTESWDGTDDRGGAVATGVYLCRITASGSNVVRKLVLLK